MLLYVCDLLINSFEGEIMKKIISVTIFFLLLFNASCALAKEDQLQLYTRKRVECDTYIDLFDLVCVRYVEDKTPIALCGYYDGYMSATIPVEFTNKEIEIFWVDDFEFNDDLGYSAEHLMFEMFEALHIRGLVLSDEKGNVYPDKYLTRGEACSLLVKLGGFNAKDNASLPFIDVSAEHMYRNDIAILYSLGIVHGINADSFDPDRLITREELVVIASNFVKALIEDCDVVIADSVVDLIEESKSSFNRDDFYSKVFKDRDQISVWAKEAYDLMDVYVMYDEDYYAYFSPQSNAKRCELAKLFFGLLEINLGLC